MLDPDVRRDSGSGRTRVFGLKMGVSWGELEFFFGFSGLIFVFGLKTGILGGAIGHLVFGKDGKKEHKCIRHKELSRKGLFLKMFDFVCFCALFGQKSGENIRKGVLFIRFCAPLIFRPESRVEKSIVKIWKF